MWTDVVQFGSESSWRSRTWKTTVSETLSEPLPSNLVQLSNMENKDMSRDVSSEIPNGVTTVFAAASKWNDSQLNPTMDGKRSLETVESAFSNACASGDIATVRAILSDLRFSVDYSDSLGRTPLRLAVRNEHLEIVELLLERCSSIGVREALLLAINSGNVQMAELIQSHTTKDKRTLSHGDDDYFFSQSHEDSQFSADTTPLILAAKRNHFQLVQMLIRQGETIPTPHAYLCNCRICINKRQFDQLRLAKTRLNAYRGLSSEAFISLSSKDPILRAFELAKELRNIAEIEKYYKTEYLSLADKLSEFVVKLLDKVRCHDELEVILNKVAGEDEEEEETFAPLERIHLAIEFNEKKFVAHPSCQQTLVSIWYSDVRPLESTNWLLRILLGLSMTILYPVLAVILWTAPSSRVARILRSPCVKFTGRMISQALFLMFILVASLEHPTDRLLTSYGPLLNISAHYLSPNCTDETLCDFAVRSSEFEIMKILIGLWLAGLLCQEIQEFYKSGMSGYFDSIFNYMDTAVIVLYITWASLKLVTVHKVKISLEYFTHETSWHALSERQTEAQLHLYWLIADRYYWDRYDPENVMEAVFAVANIISFTRISYIFPADELLGPLQISLARMATDILKFVVIFMVLFMAFYVGLHNLYWYYPPVTRKAWELRPHNITTKAEKHFGLHNQTFMTVFWATFGQTDNTAVELGEFQNIFTQNIGYWIFGAYNIAIVIVLLNMLIAMMTRSFDIIQSEADTEWKFARSKLYMEYIKGDCVLPVPFNLFPSLRALLGHFRRIQDCFTTKDDPAPMYQGRVRDAEMFQTHTTTPGRRPTMKTGTKDVKDPGQGIETFRIGLSNTLVRNYTVDSFASGKLTYKRVIHRVIHRYLFDMQRGDGDEDDTKQDISTFRHEILTTLHETRKEASEMYENMNERLGRLVSDFVALSKDKPPVNHQ
ncbi:short transient receptor potential channel 3-like [Haliotis rufescens]|uniref:short transient receptor potential channel 3-like n=1 Tax=Haliotis rufescens TaxID=6454 RepID=UPI00201F7F1F|nr:short transient receptor potential channel 3-like [Haliotis rufescens]